MVKFRQIFGINKGGGKKKNCASHLGFRPFSIVSGQHFKSIVENSEKHKIPFNELVGGETGMSCTILLQDLTSFSIENKLI